MDNFLLLHGKGENAQSSFLPWLKKRLEDQGFKVQVPDMPNPDQPVDTEQRDFVLANYAIDEYTIVLGHSFGGLVALRLLEAGKKFNKLMLLATPSTGNFLDGKERPTVSDAVKKGFDYNKIKANCKDFILLYDETDYVVPKEDASIFAAALGVKPVYVTAVGHHFSATEEPEVLKNLMA